MNKSQLVFIPAPGLSHLGSTVEAAKLLLARDCRLSVTVLIMKLPNNRLVDDYITKLSSDPNPTSGLHFTMLPGQETDSSSESKPFSLFELIDSQSVHVKEIVANLMAQSSSVAGLVLDMFCAEFVEVGNELGVPSYIFFTSGACGLGMFLYLKSLKLDHDQDLKKYKNSGEELSVPCFSIPVPAKVLPSVFVTENPTVDIFFQYLEKFTEMKGIMVNTFYELETYALESLSDGKLPKVYPVGPIINLSNQTGSQGGDGSSSGDEITKWLDDQPDSSVVFLCFGSMGSFEGAQVTEIALALERSGHRFLWSLRKSGPKGKMQFPTEYDDFQEVLPEGFVERTRGIGKVIGWAPQVKVLSHAAVGGFVSHCGWNSTLESLVCGVPMATFPLYSEQQLNAFQLVMELGLAEKIRVDYHKSVFWAESDEEEIVGAAEIEAAIRRLMAKDGGGVRKKVQEMQKKATSALKEGGSSSNAISRFIDDVMKNLPLNCNYK